MDAPGKAGERQREAAVLQASDDAAHRFLRSAQGQAALARLRGGTIPLSQPLRPGESYVTDLVFDVPLNASLCRR